MAMQLGISSLIRKGLLSSPSSKKATIVQYMALMKNAPNVVPVLGNKTQETVSAQELHVTSRKSYPAAKPLPLPDNVDDSELACFSPQRVRDISGSVIMSKVDAPYHNQQVYPVDPHVASYDCRGALSLNSVMQTNVPEPFSSDGKSTHLNMPGGQWGQGHKYISEDMQNIHYSKMSCNDSGRGGQGTSTLSVLCSHQARLQRRHFSSLLLVTDRAYCTSNTGGELSRVDKLKRAVKEYGSTVIVFHVAISLLSLGGCYLAVTSGVTFGGLTRSLGPGSEVAIEAGQFVVAYAIHKMFAPVRIGITLASTPFIVRYLRRIGFLKPPTPKP